MTDPCQRHGQEEQHHRHGLLVSFGRQMRTVLTRVPQSRYGRFIFFQNAPPTLSVFLLYRVICLRGIPSMNMTPYSRVWTMACTVAMTAIWRWNILNVVKLHPVAHRKMLFRPANIQSSGRLANDRIPVRSAIYRRYCLYIGGQLYISAAVIHRASGTY